MVGEALVPYQGIALAMPQCIGISRPFRGRDRVDFSSARYNRAI